MQPLADGKARQVYLVLRDRITSGAMPYGAKLPPEPALAETHGVARITVRRALARLAAEGLVERRPSAGTRITFERTAPPVVADIANVLAALMEMGRRTRVKLLSFVYGLPPAPVAEALGLSPGQRTQRSQRVRLVDGEPFSYLTTHVPERIGVTYSEADLANEPLLSLLDRSGVEAECATQTIGAALAAPEVARALEVDVGAPLIELTRVVFDRAGRGVEHLHAFYRPDRYSIRMDLVRTGANAGREWSPAGRVAAWPKGPRKRKRKSVKPVSSTGPERRETDVRARNETEPPCVPADRRRGGRRERRSAGHARGAASAGPGRQGGHPPAGHRRARL
jgi:GntR family transcriptional regulator